MAKKEFKPAFKSSQTAALAVMERSPSKGRVQVQSGGGKEPPRRPVVTVAEDEPGGGSLLVRGVSDALKRRLDRARSTRGLRSVNAAVLAILEEGAPK